MLSRSKKIEITIASGLAAALIPLLIWLEDAIELFSRLVVILTAILGMGCGPIPPANTSPMPSESIKYCEPACENLEKMECDFTPLDCLAFCEDVNTDVAFPTFNAICVSGAKTCKEAGGCQ